MADAKPSRLTEADKARSETLEKRKSNRKLPETLDECWERVLETGQKSPCDSSGLSVQTFDSRLISRIVRKFADQPQPLPE